MNEFEKLRATPRICECGEQGPPINGSLFYRCPSCSQKEIRRRNASIDRTLEAMGKRNRQLDMKTPNSPCTECANHVWQEEAIGNKPKCIAKASVKKARKTRTCPKFLKG